MNSSSLENIPLDTIIQVALRYHQAGQYPDAEKLYQQVLESDPDHFDALHLSGVLAYQSGNLETALTLIGKAIDRNSTSALAVFNLGEVNRMLDQPEVAAEYFLRAISLNPDYADAWNSLGIVRQKKGDLSDAEEAYRQALKLSPDSAEVHNNLGTVLHDQGRFDEAEESYQQALTLNENYAEAYNNLGTLLKDLDRLQEAESAFRRSLALNPDVAEVHNNLGEVLLLLDCPDDAIAACQQALHLRSNFAEAHANLGAALTALGRQHEARSAYNQALDYRRDLAEVYNNLGARLQNLGRSGAAEKAYRLSVALAPNYAVAYRNFGILLHTLGRFEDAVHSFRQAISCKSDYSEANIYIGASLKALGRLDESEHVLLQVLEFRPDSGIAYNDIGNIYELRGRIADAEVAYRKALTLLPDSAVAFSNLGNVLNALGRKEEAVESFNKALALNPDLSEVHNNLGCSYQSLGRLEEAIHHFQHALELNPDYLSARSNLVYQLQQICDWEKLETHSGILRQAVHNTNFTTGRISPFSFLALPHTTTAEQKSCAMAWAASTLGPLTGGRNKAALPIEDNHKEPIRIGYLSADFNDHVVSRQFIEVLERHDRRYFSISAYSYSQDDESSLRKRIERAVDSFVDISQATFEDAARTIQKDNLHILVDLTGHTANSRSAILAFRPAPIQVNYLGYPGTMGTELVDYLIADNFIIPSEIEGHYSEKIVRLPGCYLPNDSSRIRPEPLSREECGLPAQGTVFCCFNQSYKITPMMFDVWCRLLEAVPDSILWLRAFNPVVEKNIRREAELRGIDSTRIIMAPSVSTTAHLARLPCADLFLDTTPYNAHATCSDALWMGVPVITCAGESFSSRVAGSLLLTLGVPELVTYSLNEYYHLALKLVTNRSFHEKLTETIRANRETSPLYDSISFTRGLETIYKQIYQSRKV